MSIFFSTFLIYLESSETYAETSLNEIGTKLNFSSTFFFEKISQKLKIKILINEYFFLNRKIVFAYVSDYCASIGTKNYNLAIFASSSLGKTINLDCNQSECLIVIQILFI